MRVSLAHRHLKDIPDSLVKNADQITELDLTETGINDFRKLIHLKNLTTLLLDKNKLSNHISLPELPSLKVLWLNQNDISNLAFFVDMLSTRCANLTQLSLMDNPAAPSFFNGGSYVEYQDYRYFVISRLPNLNHLDYKEVTQNERKEAERIYPIICLDKKLASSMAQQ